MFGFAIGAEGDFILFLVRRYFGLGNFGLIFGFLFLIYSIGGLLGPALFGAVFDKTGSYGAALQGASAACFLASIAVACLGPSRFRFAAK